MTVERLWSELGISERRKQFARLAMTGMPIKMIAYKLGVTHRTAKFHLQGIYRAADVTSRLELMALVIEQYVENPGEEF